MDIYFINVNSARQTANRAKRLRPKLTTARGREGGQGQQQPPRPGGGTDCAPALGQRPTDCQIGCKDIVSRETREKANFKPSATTTRKGRERDLRG